MDCRVKPGNDEENGRHNSIDSGHHFSYTLTNQISLSEGASPVTAD